MQPSIALPGKNNMVVAGPKELLFGIERVKYAARALCGPPDFAPFARGRICDADRPGPPAALRPVEVLFFEVGNANECNLAAVRRPYRITIMIDARVNIGESIDG